MIREGNEIAHVKGGIIRLFTYLSHVSSNRRRSSEKNVSGATSERGESISRWNIDHLVLHVVAQNTRSQRFTLIVQRDMGERFAIPSSSSFNAGC